jgi:uncharacterized membrane protein
MNEAADKSEATASESEVTEDLEKSPIAAHLDRLDVSSAVAVAGHPIHAMSVHFPIALVIATLGVDIFYWWTADPFWVRVGLWSAGFGIAASIVGTLELLLVAGIRKRAASWAHAVAAMLLLAVAGTNWLVRMVDPGAVLPHGLLLSALATVATSLAGWHGGKLIFHHGIGLMVSAKD